MNYSAKLPHTLEALADPPPLPLASVDLRLDPPTLARVEALRDRLNRPSKGALLRFLVAEGLQHAIPTEMNSISLAELSSEELIGKLSHARQELAHLTEEISNRLCGTANQADKVSDDAANQTLLFCNPIKLPAPAGKTYTSAESWRLHIRTLFNELVDHFGRDEFRISQLRQFLESRVELLPGDLAQSPGHAIKNSLTWHKSVYNAVACRPFTWGKTGALIVYVSRNRWRLVVS